MTYIDVAERNVPSLSHQAVNQLMTRYRELSDEFARSGWCRFDLADLPLNPCLQGKYGDFTKECVRNLLPDPYDGKGLRHRRYGRFLYQPDNDCLLPIDRQTDSLGNPFTAFVQDAAYQPEHGDEVRRIPSLEELVVNSEMLRALMLADWRLGRWSNVIPPSAAYLVGVHVQRLEPQGSARAVITPNVCHRDGEVVTFVHLQEYRNVCGGWNAVTTLDGVGKHPSEVEDEHILAQFTLREPGSGFVVDDRKVAHFLEGVTLKNPDAYGCRTSLLIDFSPSRWVYSDELAVLKL